MPSRGWGTQWWGRALPEAHSSLGRVQGAHTLRKPRGPRASSRRSANPPSPWTLFQVPGTLFPCGNPQSSRPLRVCLLEEDTLASLSLCYAVLLPGCPLGHMGHCCRTKGPPLRGQPRLPPHPLVPSSQPTLPTSSAPSCHAWGLEGLEPGLASALIPQSPAKPGSVQCSTEVC